MDFVNWIFQYQNIDCTAPPSPHVKCIKIFRREKKTFVIQFNCEIRNSSTSHTGALNESDGLQSICPPRLGLVLYSQTSRIISVKFSVTPKNFITTPHTDQPSWYCRPLDDLWVSPAWCWYLPPVRAGPPVSVICYGGGDKPLAVIRRRSCSRYLKFCIERAENIQHVQIFPRSNISTCNKYPYQSHSLGISVYSLSVSLET